MSRLSLSLGFFLVSTVFAHAQSATNWNQWRGPHRDGSVESTDWPDQLQGRLELLWEKPLQPSYSGPIVNGDLVFTTETVDKKTEQVTAYSLTTGELRWTVQWPGAMSVPFFAASNGDWIRSTPVCDGKHLIVLGMRDVLVSLDPETGNQQWRVDFPEALKTPLQPFGAVCSPLIDDEAVYVQAGAALTKLSVKDGTVLWQALKGGGDMMSGGAFSSPVLATIRGLKQVVVQTRDELCGVDAENGTVLWREPIEAFRGMNILTPLVIDDRVFTAAHSGKSQLFDIGKDDSGAWTVSEIWNQKIQGYMSSPVVIDDTIYLHQKSQRFSALSVTSGEVKWTTEPFGKYWSTLHDRKKILALDENGKLLLIKANPSAFQVLDQMPVAENAWAHLGLDNDRLLVRDLKSLKVYRWK
jgi:outer membrane protein assembly factor BamB